MKPDSRTIPPRFPIPARESVAPPPRLPRAVELEGNHRGIAGTGKSEQIHAFSPIPSPFFHRFPAPPSSCVEDRAAHSCGRARESVDDAQSSRHLRDTARFRAPVGLPRPSCRPQGGAWGGGRPGFSPPRGSSWSRGKGQGYRGDFLSDGESRRAPSGGLRNRRRCLAGGDVPAGTARRAIGPFQQQLHLTGVRSKRRGAGRPHEP